MHLRRPHVALCVLTLMNAAVLMPGLGGARARAAHVNCCPASRIDLSPAVYTVRQGRWQRTTSLTHGDEARFTLLFHAYDSPYFPGAASRWAPSSATLYITRASRAGVAQGPALYSVPLARHPLLADAAPPEAGGRSVPRLLHRDKYTGRARGSKHPLHGDTGAPLAAAPRRVPTPPVPPERPMAQRGR